MGYKQANMPLSQTSLEFIDSIDPVKDCKTLKEKLGFRPICLRNFRIASIFLKMMVRAGFTLYEIGQFAYRPDNDSDWSDSEDNKSKPSKKEESSDLEKLVKEAETIYFTVRDNGIKPTVEMQIGLIKLRKIEENINHSEVKGLREMKDINSQEEMVDLVPLFEHRRSKME